MKAIFELSFLQGEIEIEDGMEEYIIPFPQPVKTKDNTYFFEANESITFYKTEDTRDNKPIFRPKLGTIINKNFGD